MTLNLTQKTLPIIVLSLPVIWMTTDFKLSTYTLSIIIIALAYEVGIFVLKKIQKTEDSNTYSKMSKITLAVVIFSFFIAIIFIVNIIVWIVSVVLLAISFIETRKKELSQKKNFWSLALLLISITLGIAIDIWLMMKIGW